MSEGLLEIAPGLFLPPAELTYRASRSGGPGGQHVNTSSTRIELLWQVADSPSLDEGQRALLLEKLAGRINSEGELRLAADTHRSQARNREEVTRRLAELVSEALRPQKPRKRTRPPRAAKEARLREKKHRSEVKRGRGPVAPEE
jgi:ribosome-associated protein